MKYVRVTNQVTHISSQEIEFYGTGGGTVFLRRFHRFNPKDKKRTPLWKLLRAGVYVLEPYAKTYKLQTFPS